MKSGDPVEVNIIWAAGGPMTPPLTHWFRGYTFERSEPETKTIMVKRDEDGAVVRYDQKDVRPAR